MWKDHSKQLTHQISDLDIHHDLLYRYLSTGLAALHELIVKPSLLIFTEEAMAQKLAEQSVAVKASREVLLRTSTLMASIAERCVIYAYASQKSTRGREADYTG